jgi:hypothetical protein
MHLQPYPLVPSATFWSHRTRVLVRPYKSPDQLLPCLYVAGDLSHFEMPALEAMATAIDYQTPGTDGRLRTWRRLNAPWLSFLYHRIEAARLLGPVHPTTLARWQQIASWAEHRWTTKLVTHALTMRPDSRYRPPALPAAA